MKGGFQKRGFGGRKSTYQGEVSGGRPYSGSTWQRGNDRDERPRMYAATCSSCGASCEVPFKPNGKKPVACNDCYKKSDERPSRGRDDERGFGRSKPYGRSSHDHDNDRFARAKPFGRSDRTPPGPGHAEVIDQLKTLNKKMDQLLKAIEGLGENA